MKTFEAVKALEEGKKVRKVYWSEDKYVMADEYGNMVDEEGKPFRIEYLQDNWELL